ncbi:MAG: tripartite tricarboxylate transporter TctB family protein, partial [Thalassobaculaceae bacterium]
ALFLLALCGLFFHASFDIEVTNYGTIQSSLWPRVILTALTAMSALFLVTSLRRADDAPVAGEGGFFRRYRNALWIFALFFLFVATLPVLGMLIGGFLFVFLALSALGPPRLAVRPLATHGAVAVLAVGLMWAIFTFGLRVILPEGELLRGLV